RISATIRTARSRSSGGYLLDEPPDMTPSFPRTGVSGHAGAVHHPVRQLPKVAKCVPNVVLGFLNEGLPYRVPYPQTTPVQESGPARPIPSGIC
ncbi:hypothetical protein ACNJRY_03495, partial [Mycobacterium tuberculosis]